MGVAPQGPKVGQPNEFRRQDRFGPRTARRSVAIGVASALGAGAISLTAGLVLVAPAASADPKTTTVKITLTSKGCAPTPAKVPTGEIQFNVSNKNAGAVSEAELRSADLSHILGEQENLTPGLSGGFSLTVNPGQYVINCPGASQPHAKFTVTGKTKGVSANQTGVLAKAVAAYRTYVNSQSAQLVSSTQTMCKQIGANNITQAEVDYPKARVYYERIEPVASVWGTLDTAIDGRIDNPVTNPAKLTGFHRIEELMWADRTLKGAGGFCSQLVKNEQRLHTLVKAADYNAVTITSGATDLINEAADSKITGEEERYSNTDFVVFQANVDGAMEIVNLFRPYLSKVDPKLLSTIDQRHQAVETALSKYRATPGYDRTGYVEYSSVLDPGRRTLSGAVQAFAESLSKMPGQVG